MVLNAFCLLDTKVGSYSAPFFVVHQGYAIRMVQDLAMDMSTQVGRHPADFVLYWVGTFDDQAGVLSPGKPESFGAVVNLIPQQGGLQLANDPE